jgi:hypothetical protein
MPAPGQPEYSLIAKLRIRAPLETLLLTIRSGKRTPMALEEPQEREEMWAFRKLCDQGPRVPRRGKSWVY